jgi:hypothetical protein
MLAELSGQYTFREDQMSKYERQPVEVIALQEGDTFELPGRHDTICRASHVSLKEDDSGRQFKIVGYDILEGSLHWPVIYLPPDFMVILLLPTTTYVKLSGKAWVDSLTEHHGVSDD